MIKTVNEYFIEQLKVKNSDISKEDIINVALECELEVKPKIAKIKIIDTLLEHGFLDKLFEYFQEVITIPEWEVADYYNIATNKVQRLKEIGAIHEEPIMKEFYSRSNRDYFNAATYPLSALNYNKDELIQAYNNAFGGDVYSLRIETKTKDEVFELTNRLGKIFKMDKSPATYEHRNADGYYSYFKVKLLNNSKEEENRLISEISELKFKNEKIKKDHQEEIEKVFTILKFYLGDDINKYNLGKKLDNLINSQDK